MASYEPHFEPETPQLPDEIALVMDQLLLQIVAIHQKKRHAGEY